MTIKRNEIYVGGHEEEHGYVSYNGDQVRLRNSRNDTIVLSRRAAQELAFSILWRTQLVPTFTGINGVVLLACAIDFACLIWPQFFGPFGEFYRAMFGTFAIGFFLYKLARLCMTFTG